MRKDGAEDVVVRAGSSGLYPSVVLSVVKGQAMTIKW